MAGLTPWHIRILCETETAMGVMRCYTPSQVGDMTLDQILVMLLDKKTLRVGKERTVTMSSMEAIGISKGGTLKGRTVDGQEFTATVSGKSMVQVIREREEAEARKKEKQAKRKRSLQ